MFAPEEQQLQICMLKLNLEEIKNELTIQNSALPILDEETVAKYHETMGALENARALNSENELLQQENVRLTAKHLQLKQRCEDIISDMEKAQNKRKELLNLLTQEQEEAMQEIHKYEESLRERADWYRKARGFYEVNVIKDDIELLDRLNYDLDTEKRQRETQLFELQREYATMQASVPENILSIVGKMELDEKLKAISIESDTINKKLKNLSIF